MVVRLLCLLVGVVLLAEPVVGQDVLVKTELALKTPRSREPVLGGSRDKVFFSVWIPEGVKTVRGGMCNPFSRDQGVSKHWQAACRHWQFAYVQTDFDAVKPSDFALLQTALAELAKKSGHPELAHMPLCFLGMSRGGGMSVQLMEMMPERTLASVPVCLEVGPRSDAGRQVPVLTIFGEKDGQQMQRLLDKLPNESKLGAHWAIAVQWDRRHEFGQANNLAFVFLDEVIAARLPQKNAVDKPVALKSIPLKNGWAGAVTTWGKDGKKAVIRPWTELSDKSETLCWFPSQRVAAVWQAFVSSSKNVVLVEPAGLGDGQAFQVYPAKQTVTVKVKSKAKADPVRVELWDAQQKLAERTEAPWEFAVSLDAGIHSLYAVVHQQDQPAQNTRPHTIVVQK